MSSSSYSDIEKYQLTPLRKSIAELRNQQAVLRENLERLCKQAFQGSQAFGRLEDMMISKGADKVCAVLNDKGWNSHVTIGLLRGSIISPDTSRQARQAIADLKVQVRAYEATSDQLNDQESAFQKIAEAAGSPTASPTPLDDRQIWGGRPSNGEEETWYHRPVNPALRAHNVSGSKPSERSWFRKAPKPEDDGEGTETAGEREPPGQRSR